jgi:hypothetical protein
MAMEDDDDFCSWEGIRGFLLEDADDVVILWARDGQRRRRHHRPSLCPFSLHKAKGTEFRFCWGKGGWDGESVWIAGSCFRPFAKRNLGVGCRSRIVKPQCRPYLNNVWIYTYTPLEDELHRVSTG